MCHLRRAIRCLLLAARHAGWSWLCLCLLSPSLARANKLSFRTFGLTEGLTSLTGTCMTRDRSGHILVCSEHGVFAFNGRRFVNLGAAQGLRTGGIVYDLVAAAAGRIVVRYADALFVSDPAAGDGSSPDNLRFHPVSLPKGVALYKECGSQVAAWQDGIAVLVDHRTMRVAFDPDGPRLLPMPYGPGDESALAAPSAIFSVRGRLWETFDDRICAADPAFVTCYGRSDGLKSGPWTYLTEGPDDTVLARSPRMLATLDLRSGKASEEALPFQGGRYQNYPTLLELFRSPTGDLVTQSDDGLLIRGRSGWEQYTVEDGLPSGIILSVFSDDGGNMWLQVFGGGLYVAAGYGHWEGWQKSDGLSDSIVWQVVKSANGSHDLSTDNGIDEISSAGGSTRIARLLPGASFALASGPNGRLWSSAGRRNVNITEPSTHHTVSIPTPPVNKIAVADGRVWLGTEDGLFTVDPNSRTPAAIRDGQSDASVADIAPDGQAGLWLLSGGRLWHRHADGERVLVDGPWPAGGFEPLVLARAASGELWIGGAGGLFDGHVVDDHMVAMNSVPQADIQSNSVVAVAIDRKGWVWAGTVEGVSVFNGRRWASATTENGLVWNDVSQGGIFADDDGSVWIATSRGVSHLLDPSWLFAVTPLRIVIADARLGDAALPSRHLPFSTAPLSVEIGSLFSASDRSLVFRYRLSGVDDGWVETTSGHVRYPFVPPGRHLLTAFAYDTLDHQLSSPVTLAVNMAYPWWRQWWAEAMFAILLTGLICAALRLKVRGTLARQRELERLVDERTREMSLIQAELKRQATLDGLTGLLNRAELQRRLASELTSASVVDDVIVALLDLDHFKQINDRCGHLVGDEVLLLVSMRIAASLRDGEYAGRYGGEEFLIVLKDADGRGAARVLELHQSIRGAPLFVDELEIRATCSIGITWAGPGQTWKSVIERADAALYEAKTSGRDRIVETRDEGVLVTRGPR